MTLDTLIKTIEPQRSHIELRAILNGYDRERFQALLNDGIITEMEFDILLMHYAEGKDFRYIGDMLGQNPVPHLFRYAHKGEFGNYENLEAIDRAFEILSKDLTAEDKLSILFIYNGEHGSSPSSIIQLIIAHLHNPLRDRIPIATSILTTYKMNEMTGNIICGEYPLPNLTLLKNAINSAIDSVGHCVGGYTNRL